MGKSMQKRTMLATAMLLAFLPAARGNAGEREDLVELRATTLKLIELLVEQGVLTREGADKLLAQAKQQAAKEVEAARGAESKQAAGKKPAGGAEAAVAATPAAEAKQATGTTPAGEAGKKVVRVGYVPEFVRNEIREQVRAELREDVTKDVLEQAKNERWGVPGALPEWTSRIKISGDMRLRGEADLYGSNNAPYGTFVNWNDVNDNNGFSNSFIDTDQNRYRGRVRLRLNVEGKVTDDLIADARITTGNTNNPVSTNQTLGDYFDPFSVVLDQAYLKYDHTNSDGYRNLTLWGGRIPDPWFHTDLVWDDDLNFDGAAGTYRLPLAGSNGLPDSDERSRSVYLTLGGFMVDEVELSSKDKTLLGAQLGTKWGFQDKSSLNVALAWYGYNNISGKKNSFDSTKNDFTAPQFVQKGNSMFDISNSPTPYQQFGLAPDFKLLDFTFKYDLARFAPTHYILSGDYVQNYGYDAHDIRNRLDGSAMFIDSSIYVGNPSDKQNEGYQLKLTVGAPEILMPRNWQVFLGYKYLERDAVLDAFTDSDFHLGGTNAKGWVLGGSYGIASNTWLTARYMTADAIDGPNLGIDVLQMDLNTKF
jgi:hypothetical protein